MATKDAEHRGTLGDLNARRIADELGLSEVALFSHQALRETLDASGALTASGIVDGNVLTASGGWRATVAALYDVVENDQTLRRVEEYQQHLFAITSPDERLALIRALISALDRLDAGDLDVVLVAARRMACLYQLLRERGLRPPSRGTIMSDRFTGLIANGAWAGKRVLLLDDTEVSGETMRKRYAAAKRLVGADDEVEKLAVLKIGPKETRRSYALHRQFALAFGENLIPFFTDFPVSREVGVTFGEFGKFLADDDWRVTEVTNEVIAGSGARAYSMFPRAELVDAILSRLGDARRLVEAIKIRVYSHDDIDGVRFRIVPLLLPAAMHEGSLRAWLTQQGVEPRDDLDQVEHAMGIVTMIVSRAALSVLSDRFRDRVGLEIVEDEAYTAVTLGPEVSMFASNATVDGLAILQPALDPTNMVQRDPTFVWPSEGRRKVKDDGTHFIAVGDDVSLPGYHLLYSGALKTDEGVAEHVTTLRDIADATHANLLAASLALDIWNDVGYSVPTQLCHNGVVFRAYRRGEAAPPLKDLRPGFLGGRMAAIPVTEQVPDSVYLSRDELADLLVD
ncbi:hypothetical protein [Pseudolysinimonas sp.]